MGHLFKFRGLLIMIMIQEQKTVNGDTRKTRVTCSYTKLANHFRGNEQ